MPRIPRSPLPQGGIGTGRTPVPDLVAQRMAPAGDQAIAEGLAAGAAIIASPLDRLSRANSAAKAKGAAYDAREKMDAEYQKMFGPLGQPSLLTEDTGFKMWNEKTKAIQDQAFKGLTAEERAEAMMALEPHMLAYAHKMRTEGSRIVVERFQGVFGQAERFLRQDAEDLTVPWEKIASDYLGRPDAKGIRRGGIVQSLDQGFAEGIISAEAYDAWIRKYKDAMEARLARVAFDHPQVLMAADSAPEGKEFREFFQKEVGQEKWNAWQDKAKKRVEQIEDRKWEVYRRERQMLEDGRKDREDKATAEYVAMIGDPQKPPTAESYLALQQRIDQDRANRVIDDATYRTWKRFAEALKDDGVSEDPLLALKVSLDPMEYSVEQMAEFVEQGRLKGTTARQAVVHIRTFQEKMKHQDWKEAYDGVREEARALFGISGMIELTEEPRRLAYQAFLREFHSMAASNDLGPVLWQQGREMMERHAKGLSTSIQDRFYSLARIVAPWQTREVYEQWSRTNPSHPRAQGEYRKSILRTFEEMERMKPEVQKETSDERARKNAGQKGGRR